MIERVAVVVPAHDEEALVGACLDAVQAAAAAAAVPVEVLVVLDACTDGTAAVVAARGVRTIAGSWRNVGRARRRGFAAAAGPDLDSTWLATTDADTVVAADWVTRQVALADRGADAVCGVVEVTDWSQHPSGAAAVFAAAYAADPAPVHGANLGVRARAYTDVDGFAALPVGEDRDLVARLVADPRHRVVFAPDLRVVTSGRALSRVVGGFATTVGEVVAG